MTHRLWALMLALVVVAVACGGRGGDGLSRAEQSLADSLAADLQATPGTPFDAAAAHCFAERMIADLGAARLLALEFASGGHPQGFMAGLDEREVELFIAGLVDCVDFTEQFVEGLALDGVSRSSAECLYAALEGTTFIHDLILAGFGVGHDEALLDEALESTIAAHLPAFLAGMMHCLTPEELAALDDDDLGPGPRHPAVSVFALRVGDCFDDPPFGGEIDTVSLVPCAEPHDNQVYFIFDLPDGPFPGEDEAVRLADDGCFDAFEPFVGADYWDSDLDFFAIYPTQQSWTAGDRTVTCALYASDLTKLVGSMRGVGPRTNAGENT